MINFRYAFAKYPTNKYILKEVESAANRLYSKLQNFSIEHLSLSDSFKRYSISVVNERRARLELCVFNLSWAIAECMHGYSKNIADLVFVDYGGGVGLMSMLAREMNMNTIYIDIDEQVVKDAKTIAGSLGINATYYLTGDVDDLIRFIKDKEIQVDIIHSFDVIEHIYDIEEYICQLVQLSDVSYLISMGTGANIFNRRKVKKFMKKHYRAEYEERDAMEGGPRDCNKSFFEERKKIISNHSDKLSKDEIVMLATRTRGKKYDHILESVDRYLQSGELPNVIDHPTNTCDPYTGNWCERLMDPEYIIKILSNCGFGTKLIGGYYSQDKGLVKKVISFPLNFYMRCFPRVGLRLAPYYVFFAEKLK